MFNKGNKVVVPIILKSYLLQLAHNYTFHQGSAKTRDRLMQCYYWSNYGLMLYILGGLVQLARYCEKVSNDSLLH